MGITVNQIAEICGVSRTTVLRALNNKGRIGKNTKKRILSVAKEHDYRPNLLARSLNKGRTMTIGVVAINVENMVFVQSLSAINQEVEKRGYFLKIVIQGNDMQSEVNRIQHLANHQVDGILVNPLSKGSEYEKFLLSLGIPVVCIGNFVSDAISTAMVDEKQAAKDAVNLIASKGYKRVIFVCPPMVDKEERNIYSHIQRDRGFREETGYLSLESEILIGENYLEQLEPMLKSSHKRTAILCSGDIYALKIMHWLENIGLGIPDDVGVMGFDDIDTLQYIKPGLTTISTNVLEVAVAAVSELVSQIEDSSIMPKKIVLNHKVLERESL